MIFLVMYTTFAFSEPFFTILLVCDFHNVEFLKTIVVFYYADSTNILSVRLDECHFDNNGL